MSGENHDYSQRGPCCDYHQKIKAMYEGQIRGILAVVGGSPRYAHQIYDILTQHVSVHMLAFALSEKCLCHEHPNPPLFREFMGKLLALKDKGNIPDSIDDRLDLLESLANAVLKANAEKK